MPDARPPFPRPGEPVAPVTAPWAKAGKEEEPHPLVCHAIDTAAVARLLYPLFLGPAVRAELEAGLAPLGDDPKPWIWVLCGLHDLGKLSPAFQALRYDIAVRRMGEQARPILAANRPLKEGARQDTRHGDVTALHFQGMLRDLGCEPRTANRIADVLGGHHGWMPNPGVVRKARDIRGHHGKKPWRAARDALVEAVAGLYGLDVRSSRWDGVRLSTAAAVGLAGLTTISDWIASDPENFPFHPGLAPDAASLAGYKAEADKRADEFMERLGWVNWEPPARIGYRDLFQEDPYNLQRTVESLVAGRTEPGVLVVEAPTGEGKTKAGLLAAAHLARALGMGGLYFAMPTRALSSQAGEKVDEFLAAMGSELRANLVFGKGKKGVRRRGAVAPKHVAQDGPPTGAEGDTAAEDPAEWFTRKRGLAFPIGAGTIDQVLQGVIRSGHDYLRLAALSNKVLVIDEVHAYDTHTGTLLDRLLWWAGRLGVPVVLMSATLPADRREQLIEEWRAGRRGGASADPRSLVAGAQPWQVTWVDAEDRESEPFELSPLNKKRPPVGLTPLPDDLGAVAQALLDRVREDGAALAVLNTKSRATGLYRHLEEALRGRADGPRLLYLDGDLEGPHRRAREAEVLAHLGPKHTEPRHAIVVGTQLLEHGLDIDADVLASDISPIDLIIQRLGRLHRHDRSDRPAAVAVPELLLIDTSPEELAKRRPSSTSLGFPKGISNVYSPLRLASTREALRNRDEIDTCADTAKLVHQVYVEIGLPGDETRLRAWEVAEEAFRRRRDNELYGALVPALTRMSDADPIRSLTYRSGSPNQTRLSKGAPEEKR